MCGHVLEPGDLAERPPTDAGRRSRDLRSGLADKVSRSEREDRLRQRPPQRGCRPLPHQPRRLGANEDPGQWRHRPHRHHVERLHLGQPLDDVFRWIDRTPVAAASIAQVHAATLRNGVPVVVKVQRPAVATLVHDDIIDESELRRGRQAVHSRWGNDITVLLGDFLYIKSMSMALTQDRLDIIRLLCDVTLRMIEGELYQLTKNGEVDITEDEHFEIIRRKTAYLFGGCAEIGGMLGNVDETRALALREYGFNLGIMFQLVDDLLDFTGESDTLGKPVGGDLREGKMTLPVIHLLAKGGPGAETLIRQVLRDRHVSIEQWREVRRLLGQHRAGRAAEVDDAPIAVDPRDDLPGCRDGIAADEIGKCHERGIEQNDAAVGGQDAIDRAGQRVAGAARAGEAMRQREGVDAG